MSLLLTESFNSSVHGKSLKATVMAAYDFFSLIKFVTNWVMMICKEDDDTATVLRDVRAQKQKRRKRHNAQEGYV